MTRAHHWCVLLGLLAVSAQPAAAQWSFRPTLAVGPVIPSSDLRSGTREGPAIKAGFWIRTPRVPVGLAIEGLYLRLPSGGQSPAADAFTAGGVALNLTTRRHSRRLETYGTAGAGWYRLSGGPAALSRDDVPGLNIGIGEIIAVGEIDYFIELRAHTMRTPSPDGSRWSTFAPIVLGVRF